MKHFFALRGVKDGATSLIPIGTYKCDECGRIEHIYLNATKALVEILTLNDCEGKKGDELTLREQLNYSRGYLYGLKDCVELFKSQLNDQKKIDIIIKSIDNISNRL